MDGGSVIGGQPAQGRTALLDRVNRYGGQTLRPVRDVRGQLPPEAVRVDVHGRQVRLNLKLMSYWIPFLLGVGLMIGGMKTAGVPFLSVPQLILGIVLMAVTSWDYISDSGRLDLKGPPGRIVWAWADATGSPAAAVPARSTMAPTTTRRRRTYDDKFRRYAVDMVCSTGRPIAAVARDLEVNPGTLGAWVKKDRLQREQLIGQR